jgi:predicted nucleotide-binding protein (sugar kinase/HSP70/actin superfamily)/activator of 2-hydroxyglutaryl-CoA dehydratase
MAPTDLITAPPDAQYFGAIGAVHYGRHEDLSPRLYAGAAGLGRHVEHSDGHRDRRHGVPGLVASKAELDAFARRYAPPPFVPPRLAPGCTVPAFLGVDGGSTSTKGVALSPAGEVICKAYRLSKGNPIDDTTHVLRELRDQVESQGASLDVLGLGTTGYARTLLRDVFEADVALVETVAHAEAARRFCEDPEVIVDVGGQDIKLIVLRNGRIADFKLNTQCSAGNGFFLQATAESFGIPIEDYAQAAFSARSMPVFGYGCAVFLQTDIVNLQRLGWRAPEILAGLAAVLPKNVFLYVAKAPNLSRLGRRFVLQGATQRNLAVVKAEVDFIAASFAGTGITPHVVVHEHCGEGGAIGAALEARRQHVPGRPSTFIGFDAAAHVAFTTRRGEETRCRFCKNACLRTVIDVDDGMHRRRVIVASCEKGEADGLSDMREIKADIDRIKAASPNLVEVASRDVWAAVHPPRVAPHPPRGLFGSFVSGVQRSADRAAARARVRIGIPRALHQYSYAPLFSAYFESLGIAPTHLVYSDFTSTDLYRAGCSRGSIDPCFPSKVALSHVHNLLWVKHRRTPLDFVFFPMCDVLRSPHVGARACNGCPTATITPDTVRAAFTKERDSFAEHGIAYVSPMLDLSDRRLFAYQMYEAWSAPLGLHVRENAEAVAAAFCAQDAWEASLRHRGREVLERLVAEDRLGIVLLGRAYHHDEGLNHGIPEALQKRGYPILSQSTLPLDDDLLDELFGDEVRAGVIAHPLDVSDVWKNTTSASTTAKLWAAKFTARHPNLVGIELSSFKCGHDAPVYSVIEEIFASVSKPFFAFRDLDENKATGSIALRVDTIDYFLRRHREALVAAGRARAEIARQLEAFERRWRNQAALVPEVPHDDALAG